MSNNADHIRDYFEEQNQEPLTLRVTLDPGATMPVRQHETDAGLDLYPLKPVDMIRPGDVVKIPTGVHVAIPPGYCGVIMGRSSLASQGLFVGGGLIDEFFRGDVTVVLANVRNLSVTPVIGKAIGQLVILPVSLVQPVLVESLEDTPRGHGGFGSTDHKS